MLPKTYSYETTTKEIRVSVQSVYLEDQSEPQKDHYVWAYIVNVLNEGEKTVQLLNRHWKIIDARGHVQDIKGPGVVGEQPIIGPGDCFEYTSGTPLNTPSGFMRGGYEMESEDGEIFLVNIPPFSLDSPHQKHTLN
ncbi:MAG: Co2+/Mg2+ efflux protein ApaG [Sphingomonadales bacterium]